MEDEENKIIIFLSKKNVEKVMNDANDTHETHVIVSSILKVWKENK